MVLVGRNHDNDGDKLQVDNSFKDVIMKYLMSHIEIPLRFLDARLK